MMTIDQFQNPPADYRPMPLWVWNDELSPQRVREQLREFHRIGMGGAFVHPRPGLISEYLGDEWWACFSAALDEAKKLGMKLQIYDENSYPSGFAGGHVPSQLPHTVATGVTMRPLVESQTTPPVNRLKNADLYACAQWEGERYAFESTHGQTTHWLGGFAYVDLMRRETTDKFLEITHEQYYKRFETEFGKTITAVFYDEPMVGNGGIYLGSASLPFSYWFAAQFQRHKHYDIIPEIPKLFLDMPGYQKVRHDYYDMLHQLFVENWAKPMQSWCREHHVAVTGHYMEHSWLYPYKAGTPNAMAMYEWMDIPGIDMLESRVGRVGVKKSLGLTPQLLLLTVRELLSAANQIGHARTLCETYGAGGYDSTFEDYKRIGDWLYVHGVNYQTQHLSYMTIRGARKRDHPQTFSEHAAWWPQYKSLCDYFGRLSFVLSQGRMRQRVLLVHPTTSGWVEANPVNGSKNIKPLHDSYTQLVEYLCDQFWDFDLGDEFIMENRGKIDEKSFCVGLQQYDVIIIPAHICNLRSPTVSLLETFTRHGGCVFILGDAPNFVDGEPSASVKQLAEQWTQVSGHDQLDQLLDQTIGRQLRIEKTQDINVTPPDADWPSHLAVMRRELDDKTTCYFFTNTSNQRVKFKATLQEHGTAECWDAMTGEATFVDCEGWLDLDLPHCGSALYVIHLDKKNNKLPNEKIARLAESQNINLELVAIEPQELNTLVIDYGDVTLGNQMLKNVHHGEANIAIAQAHGFNRSVWDNAVQFKRNLLDQDDVGHVGDGTGFESELQFEIASKPAHLELAIECPGLYDISVNGHRLSFDTATCWLDSHIQSVDITPWVKNGDNHVTITADPYRIRMELEPVYLRGDFNLESTRQGFRIVAPQPLSLGSWRKQGRPFYSGAICYDYRCHIDPNQGSHILRLTEWAGAVATVTVNDQDVGIIGWPQALTIRGGYEIDMTRALHQGDNRLRITVFGTLKNTIGPFHCYVEDSIGENFKHDAPPRGTAWPAMWFVSPKTGPPPGDQYDGIDYGLFVTPKIVTVADDRSK